VNEFRIDTQISWPLFMNFNCYSIGESRRMVIFLVQRSCAGNSHSGQKFWQTWAANLRPVQESATFHAIFMNLYQLSFKFEYFLITPYALSTGLMEVTKGHAAMRQATWPGIHQSFIRISKIGQGPWPDLLRLWWRIKFDSPEAGAVNESERMTWAVPWKA